MSVKRLLAPAVAVLVLLAAGAVAYAIRDDVQARQRAAQQAGRAADLSRQLAAARTRSDGLASQLTSARAEDARLQTELRNPTLSMWNSCGGPCPVNPGTVRVGSVPDTFELRLSLTADVPVRVYVVTFHQWTEFDACGLSVRCVSGSYLTFGPATSIDTTITSAEGCSGYVWVLQSDGAGTVTPDVSVRYQPSGQPTGFCAANP